jgi:heme oxygenase
VSLTLDASAPVVEQTIPLATRLREGTREVHSEAENVTFIADLMGGKLTVEAYRDLAAQQHYIYTALEEATRNIAGLEQAESLTFSELVRTPSIDEDLTFLIGEDWAEQITPLPSTLAYVERLKECSSSMALYAAHAYTRYLGDLSGGQVIRVMMQRHYGMGAEGLSFYVFKEIDKAKPFKDLYRERLNALSLTEDELEQTVAEAVAAFRLNQALFAELGETHCA